jgi:F0F1-type ATP synthase assembly protein I
MKVISEKETPLVNGPKSLSFVIILYTIIGIVVGVVLGWLISFYKKAKNV